MRAWRWPVLLLLVASVAMAVVIERRPTEVVERRQDLTRLMPVVTAPGTLGSTWYCAGGVGDHTVVIANGSDRGLPGRVTAYPSEGDRAVSEFTLEPYEVRRVRVDEMVEASDVAALVEVQGGEVAVQHEVLDDAGRSVGSCASEPATSWYFPAGTTRAGAEMVLSVFNPFPGDAVLDVTFDTDDGGRTPQAYQGMVVPGGRLVKLAVSEVVTLREQVATRVEARSGRVVVDQIQIVDGSDGGARGMAVTLGATAPAQAWVFPDGIGADAYGERFILFNPGDQPAEVDVAVMLDDPAVNGFAEPFDVRVPSGRYAVVDVYEDGRVPTGTAHNTLISSRNGVGVVAEREITGSTASAQPGFGYTIGSPLTSTRWIAAIGSTPGTSGAAVIIANPSASMTARVVVRVLRGGSFRPVGTMDGVEIAPGGRMIFDVADIATDSGQFAVEVGSDNPVAVETRFGFSDGNDLSYLVADPVADALAPISLDDLFGGMSSEDFVVGG